VYIGSVLPPRISGDIFEAYKEYGITIGKYLYETGYTGVAGIDSIITEQDEIIPVVEINGRFTLSTYISFIDQKLKDKKVLSRYFRFMPDKAVGYGELLKVLEQQSILISPENKEGVFIYTAGTLPYKLHEGSDYFVGRVFALIISEDWSKIEEYNSKLENVISSFS